MPRGRRPRAGEYCYLVINHGNARAEEYRKQDDYLGFERIIAEVSLCHPIRALAHWLLVSLHWVSDFDTAPIRLGPGLAPRGEDWDAAVTAPMFDTSGGNRPLASSRFLQMIVGLGSSFFPRG